MLQAVASVVHNHAGPAEAYELFRELAHEQNVALPA
jgi:hypothetical protein